MANLIHYGYAKEYMLLHVPWVPLYTRFAKESLPSSIRPGFYDHTTNSVLWLGHFKSQNATLLNKLDLKTDKDYTWSAREVTPAGSKLTDLVDHGIARPVYAAESVYSLIEQIKYHSTAGRCKAMVCVDGVNGMFYTPREVWREDKSMVPHTHITFFEAFKQMFKNDWSGGVVIGTVDKLALPAEYRESDFPRYLLNKEGWEMFDPFIPIHVENYTSQEVQTTIDYYLDRKWLQHPMAGSEKGRQELEYLSTKNPLWLMKLANAR
jgi:small subunit ribosomal protein S29